jgi:acyl-homoserine lactone acylase PvdQ
VIRHHPLTGAGPFPPVPNRRRRRHHQAAAYGWRQGTPFIVLNLSVYRQVVDVADPAAASFEILGGSSGDLASPHFDDQLAAWARHERIAMFPSPD